MLKFDMSKSADERSDLPWSQVVGRGSNRQRVQGGGGQGSPLQSMPGALGLVRDDRGVQLRQQQQQQRLPRLGQQHQRHGATDGPRGHYPKVVSKKAGFRQVTLAFLTSVKLNLDLGKCHQQILK